MENVLVLSGVVQLCRHVDFGRCVGANFLELCVFGQYAL
jgi:hypothetical protein